MSYTQPYTFETTEKPVNTPILPNLNNLSHGTNDFGVGDTFRAPYIEKGAEKWSGTANMVRVHQAQVNAATPTRHQLDLIGGSSTLPGPNIFGNDSYVAANVNDSRANKLNLCSSNWTNLSAGSGVSSSLLPSPHGQNMKEGFADCDVTNVLANQVFLSPGGQIGFDTTGSNRNSNLDLRSAPPCPILNVGPWMNSTIQPDLLRRPLEDAAPSFGLYGNGANSSVTPVSIQQ